MQSIYCSGILFVVGRISGRPDVSGEKSKGGWVTSRLVSVWFFMTVEAVRTLDCCSSLSLRARLSKGGNPCRVLRGSDRRSHDSLTAEC